MTTKNTKSKSFGNAFAAFEQKATLPSAFAHTIDDTNKLGNKSFKKIKYIKKDSNIGKKLEGKDSDLQGLGDVISKVKKEKVPVGSGAIRKHKMVKQLSGRISQEDLDKSDHQPVATKTFGGVKLRSRNSITKDFKPPMPRKNAFARKQNGTTKKTNNFLSMIDDAIENEPTEQAKEIQAAKKAAAAAPIPPKTIKKKPLVKSSQSPGTLKRSTIKSPGTLKKKPSLPSLFKSPFSKKEKVSSLAPEVGPPLASPTIASPKLSKDSAKKDKVASPRARREKMLSPKPIKDKVASPTAKLRKLISPKQNKGKLTSPKPKEATTTSFISPKPPKKSNVITSPKPKGATTSLTSPKPKKDNAIASPKPKKASSLTSPKPKKANSVTSPKPKKANSLTSPKSKKENSIASPKPKKEKMLTSPKPRKANSLTSPRTKKKSLTPKLRKSSLHSKSSSNSDESPSQTSQQKVPAAFASLKRVTQSPRSSVKQGTAAGFASLKKAVLSPRSSSKKSIATSPPEDDEQQKEEQPPSIASSNNAVVSPQSIQPNLNSAVVSPRSFTPKQTTTNKADPPTPTNIAYFAPPLGSDDSDSDSSESSSDDSVPLRMTATPKSELANGGTTLQMDAPKTPPLTEANPEPEPSKEEEETIPSPPKEATPEVYIPYVDQLRAKIKETEQAIEKSRLDAKIQMGDMKRNFESEKERLRSSFAPRINAQKKQNEKEDKKNQKLMDEDKKIVDNLREENKRLRATKERIPKQIAEVKQNSASLESANEEIAGHFEQLNTFAKKLQLDHNRLNESNLQCREQYLPRYRQELWERQTHLDSETKIKNLYRNCVRKIRKQMEKSKQADLLEEVNEMVLATEAEINPKFDPKLLFADDSDKSSSSSSSSDDDSSVSSDSSSDSD